MFQATSNDDQNDGHNFRRSGNEKRVQAWKFDMYGSIWGVIGDFQLY